MDCAADSLAAADRTSFVAIDNTIPRRISSAQAATITICSVRVDFYVSTCSVWPAPMPLLAVACSRERWAHEGEMWGPRHGCREHPSRRTSRAAQTLPAIPGALPNLAGKVDIVFDKTNAENSAAATPLGGLGSASSLE